MNFKKTSPAVKATKTLSLALVCLVVASCSNLPAPKPNSLSQASLFEAQFKNKEEVLLQLDQWDIKGKLAVKIDGKNNSGLITWNQRQDHFEMLLNGPLGSGRLHIKGNGSKVVATTNQETLESASLELLFENEFGWQFPMQELHYWVRGIAYPKSPSQLSYNEQGGLARIAQKGWIISYPSYQPITQLTRDDSSKLLMPKKIEVENAQVKLTLVIKTWGQLAPLPKLNHN